MKKLTVILVVLALSMTMFSCGGNNTQENKTESQEPVKVESQGLLGSYLCTEHWNDALIGQIKMTFENDSVSLAGISKTTYRIDGDSLFIDMHQYELGFVIDGNNLTTSGSAGKVSYRKD